MFSSPRRLYAVAGVLLLFIAAITLRFRPNEMRTPRPAQVYDGERAPQHQAPFGKTAAPGSALRKPAIRKAGFSRTEGFASARDVSPTSITAILLEGGNAAAADQLIAFIASAQINSEDAGEQIDRQLRGSTGAGAANMLELANVTDWTSATVEREPTAPLNARVVSNPLTPSPLYEIAAYDYLNQRFYHARISASELQTTSSHIELQPTGATGVAVSLHNAEGLGSAIVLHLQREVSKAPGEAARAGQVLHLTRLFKPKLASVVLDEDPLLLPTTASTVLAPLPDDPAIGIRLSTATDLETGTLVFQLHAGQIVPVDIDCSTLFQPRDVTGTTLHARILLENTEKPVTGAEVSRLREDAPVEKQVSDSNGEVVFAGLPLSVPTTFEVQTTAAENSRPLAPRTRFTFEPPASGELLDSEVTWRLKPYLWISMSLPHAQPNITEGTKDLPANSIRILDRSIYKPFPIYVLQKLDPALETWNDSAIDETVEDADEIAFSIKTPGEYRIGVVPSAIELYFTNSVRVSLSADARVAFPRFTDPKENYSVEVHNPDGSRNRGPAKIYSRYGAMHPTVWNDTSRELRIPIPAEPLELEFNFPQHQPMQMLIPTHLPSKIITINLQN